MFRILENLNFGKKKQKRSHCDENYVNALETRNYAVPSLQIPALKRETYYNKIDENFNLTVIISFEEVRFQQLKDDNNNLCFSNFHASFHFF